jgi:hypothetical protein
MSPTARVALIVVCWTVTLLTELAGLLLLALEGRRTGRALRRWREIDPETEGIFARQRQLDDLVDVLTGRPFDRLSAVALLATGVVVGAIGAFLSL